MCENDTSVVITIDIEEQISLRDFGYIDDDGFGDKEAITSAIHDIIADLWKMRDHIKSVNLKEELNMTIIPANQIKCGPSREDIVNAFCENLMNRIQERAKEGGRKICFDASVYHENETGQIYSTYQNKWRGVKDAYDSYKYRFDDYADEIKAKFKQAGYIIKPTGYIGGVWQLTEDLMW